VTRFKKILLVGGALAVIVGVAHDTPPTLLPYPARFIVVMSSESGEHSSTSAYILDRWTGRAFYLQPGYAVQVRHY
jgi:hypothetical protein